MVQALTLLLVSALVVWGSLPVRGAEVTSRSLALGDSGASATTTHDIKFGIVSVTDIGSMSFEYCSNSAFLFEPCTASIGLDLLGATLSTQIGETGFSIHANTTANRMVITRTIATPIPGSVNYVFSDVLNPSVLGAQYLRVATYGSTDGTGPRIDEGAMAINILDTLQINVYVPPVLEFCLGRQITGFSCATATGSFEDLDELSPTETKYATTQMVAGTNAFGGYTISAVGTTMTSGNKVISNLTTPQLSVIGTQQFGLNLALNTIPNVGASVSGVGVGFATPDYNTVNQYKYLPGDVVARSLTSSERNKFTSSYIVNIAADQAPGVYATTITYIALASF